MIELFHTLDSKNLNSIIHDGLKSLHLLIEEKKKPSKDFLHDFEVWRSQLIFFNISHPLSGNWVSIQVDSDSVFVGNQVLELSYDLYDQSKMLLSEYLDKQSVKGEYSHPLTGEVSSTFTVLDVPNTYALLRGDTINYRRGIYVPEAFIETPLITEFSRSNN